MATLMTSQLSLDLTSGAAAGGTTAPTERPRSIMWSQNLEHVRHFEFVPPASPEDGVAPVDDADAF
jgi:hypothetical protein